MYVYTLLNNQFTLKVEVKHRTEFLGHVYNYTEANS